MASRQGKRWRFNLCPAKMSAVALLVMYSLAGCRVPGSLAQSDENSPQYQRASIVYELDATQRPLPLAASDIKPVSFGGSVEPSSAPIGQEWAGATLTVQFPHPDGTADTARATLRLIAEAPSSSRSAVASARRWLGWNRTKDEPSDEVESRPNAARDDEIWVLDLPKQQLDLLLTDLQQNGFFQAQTRSQAGTHLDVQVNWGRIQKEWSSEPRLDHFISRVYREGRLEGLVSRNTPQSQPDIYAGR